MLRAAAWTVGLFGAGAALCRLFPAGWFEPVVLVALGVTLLGVSRGGARRPRARVAAPKQAAA